VNAYFFSLEFCHPSANCYIWLVLWESSLENSL